MVPEGAARELDPRLQIRRQGGKPATDSPGFSLGETRRPFHHLHQLKAFFQSLGRIERKAAFSFNTPSAWAVGSFHSPPRSRSEPPLARGDLLDGRNPPSCSRAPRASPDRKDSPGRGG